MDKGTNLKIQRKVKQQIESGLLESYNLRTTIHYSIDKGCFKSANSKNVKGNLGLLVNHPITKIN